MCKCGQDCCRLKRMTAEQLTAWQADVSVEADNTSDKPDTSIILGND